MDFPDIPDFLKVANRTNAGNVALRPYRKKREKKRDWRIPLSMDATSWAILREQEHQREEKKKARLAALKEWKATR